MRAAAAAIHHGTQKLHYTQRFAVFIIWTQKISNRNEKKLTK